MLRFGTHARAATILSVLALAGCEDGPACDEPGYVLDADGNCIARPDMDGGMGGSDAGDSSVPPGDAGPCGECPADHAICRESDGGADCVACTEDSPCATGQCDLDTGECVDCLTDAHCADPSAPTCTSGTCTAGCTGPADCERFATEKVCADDGECVQCTASDREACMLGPGGRNVCDPDTHTCTSTMASSASVCDACIADAQCQDGQLCVHPMFEGSELEDTYCLWRADSAGGPCATAVQPYVEDRPDVTSVDGVTTHICDLRASTCEAQDDFEMTGGCTGEGEATDECGVMGLADSYCFEFAAGVYFCSPKCTSGIDCDPSTQDCVSGHCESL